MATTKMLSVRDALRISKSSSICTRCLLRLRKSNGNNSTIYNNARYSSTSTSTADTPPPPLLSKIREDLKTAMRNKDASRLSVLRAIISETNQAASGPNPIKSDMQIISLLKKRKAASQAAAKEADDAQRPDLKEKQEKEIQVIDEYAGSVKMVDEDELKGIVREAVQILGGGGSGDAGGGMKAGMIMKELLKPDGPLDGKMVDKAQLSQVVKKALEGH